MVSLLKSTVLGVGLLAGVAATANAQSIGSAIGRQHATVVWRHVASAECPHRDSGIDAKLLSQARGRGSLDGAPSSARGAIRHRGISIRERDRPQTPLVKGSIGP
jgi:hypothetical protein